MTLHSPQDAEPRGDLITALLQGFSRLVRGEIELAKAEVAQSARSAMRGAIFAAIAGVMAIAGIGLLAAACAAGLMAWGLDPALSLLATAVIFLIACLVFARVAAGLFQRAGNFNARSARNLSRDFQTLKAGVMSDAT